MLYVKKTSDSSTINSILPNDMKTVHTNESASILMAESNDSNFSHYIYTAYIMQTRLVALSMNETLCTNNTCIRTRYDVNSIKAGDVIYFDYIINNPINFIDFNDTIIEYNLLKTSDSNYRVFGLYTVTQYDITGTSGGRLYDYDQKRFFDLNSNYSLTMSNEDTYLNPTINNGTFGGSLSIPNSNIYTTFYKIQAVDLAGNISQPTYTLVSY